MLIKRLLKQKLNIKEDLDFNKTDQPYVIKKYARDWYAFNNWSFDFLKKLDKNLFVIKDNAIIKLN